jgi:peptide/nickel transport system permease protein
MSADSPTSSREAAWLQVRLGARRLAGKPLAMLGFGIVVLLVLIAIAAPWLATHNPMDQRLELALQAPSAAHWFGTDELGRDIFSRIVYGSRYTLLIAFLVSITVAPIGLLIGCTSGYMGGWTDTVLMRITDLFLSFPGLALALAFVAALGAGLENAILAIALTAWPPIARLARAETLSVRSSDYIAAVRLMGAGPARIVLRHIVPLCLSSVVVRLTLSMAGIILTAAGLGFLGLGAQPPTPEWGAMTSTGRNFLLDAWWLAGIPGIAILTVSLAFNLLGDGLRDVLDPRAS